MKKTRLSPEQAFDAMLIFLSGYYQRTGGKGELAALLGDLQINYPDGRSFDPAAWDDWLAAVDSTLKKAGRPATA